MKKKNRLLAGWLVLVFMFSFIWSPYGVKTAKADDWTDLLHELDEAKAILAQVDAFNKKVDTLYFYLEPKDKADIEAVFEKLREKNAKSKYLGSVLAQLKSPLKEELGDAIVGLADIHYSDSKQRDKDMLDYYDKHFDTLKTMFGAKNPRFYTDNMIGLVNDLIECITAAIDNNLGLLAGLDSNTPAQVAKDILPGIYQAALDELVKQDGYQQAFARMEWDTAAVTKALGQFAQHLDKDGKAQMAYIMAYLRYGVALDGTGFNYQSNNSFNPGSEISLRGTLSLNKDAGTVNLNWSLPEFLNGDKERIAKWQSGNTNVVSVTPAGQLTVKGPGETVVELVRNTSSPDAQGWIYRMKVVVTDQVAKTATITFSSGGISMKNPSSTEESQKDYASRWEVVKKEVPLGEYSIPDLADIYPGWEVRDTNEFLFWRGYQGNADKDDAPQYKAGEKITIKANLTLYANFNPHIVFHTYNIGGTGWWQDVCVPLKWREAYQMPGIDNKLFDHWNQNAHNLFGYWRDRMKVENSTSFKPGENIIIGQNMEVWAIAAQKE